MTEVEVELRPLRYDVSPLGPGKNWVSERGGLPSFVRAIAHALIRHGHSESGAIQLAIGAVKRWAAGGGHVHPDTRARAAAAVAHWEALKAGRSDEEMIRAAGAPPAAGSAYAAGHPFFGNQWTKMASANTVGGPGSSTKSGFGVAKGGKGGKGGGKGKGKGKGGAAKSAASAAAAAAAKQAALQAAVDSARRSFASAQLSQSQAAQRHQQAVQQAARDIAYAKSKVQVTKTGVIGQHNVDQVTQTAQQRVTSAQQALDTANLRLSQAQQVLDAAKKKAGVRSDGHEIILRALGEGNPPGTDAAGASLLLPVGPSKKQSAAIVESQVSRPHPFEGTDLRKCARCGQPVTAAVHHGVPGQPIPPVPRMLRHAGPGHRPVPTGHIKGSPSRHAQAAKAQAAAHFDQVEGPLTDALQSMFASQRKSAQLRLAGKRGKQTLKRMAELRAGGPNEPPEIPPEDTGQPPPVSPSIGPGGLFDAGFAAEQARQVLQPHLQTAGALAAGAVASQLALPVGLDTKDSLGALQGVVSDRASAAANFIANTTARQLSEALLTGVAQGEGIPAIAKRVNEVFDNADIVRAKRIAQTEVVGAYNEAAHAYAAALPPDVIGSRRWLAHKDDRTRPTHRIADGQEQPVGAPFWVGGYPMMYPGDKAAAPSEWINCRCSVAYMPPGLSYGGIAKAAEDYVAGLKAVPPPPVSPYATAGV